MSNVKTGPVTLHNAEVGDKVHCTYSKRNGEIFDIGSLAEGDYYPIGVSFDFAEYYAANGGFFSEDGECHLFHGHNPAYPEFTNHQTTNQ